MTWLHGAARGLALVALPILLTLPRAGAASSPREDSPLPAAAAPDRALVTVRTLVIDALGTRTVDTDIARIPIGGRGLLIKKVPYAGPPLSFRAEVAAGVPQEAGIPLTISAEVWSGEISSRPPSDALSRREEATVLSAEGSYLFELDHDERTDRRVVLSLSARPVLDLEPFAGPPPALEGAVSLLVEVTRQAGDRADPPDTRRLDTRLGLPVSYSSGVRIPSSRHGGEPRFVGLSMTLTPERAQGLLMTVGVRLAGADFLDDAETLLKPFSHAESHTVTSGTPFTVVANLPSGPEPLPPGSRTVSYRVTVTPSLVP